MCTTHASEAITVSKASTYFKKDFSNVASMSYYTENRRHAGEWTGQLATEMGLVGAVEEKQFQRLADGRDPHAKYDPSQLRDWKRQADGSYHLETKKHEMVAKVWKEDRYWHCSNGETIHSTERAAMNAARNREIGQLIEHRHTVTQKEGKALERRAGIDIVFNYDKSVSITGAHDNRVYEAAHKASLAGARAMEEFMQLHMGGKNDPQATSKWIAAVFSHTTARPEKVEIQPGKEELYSAPHYHDHVFLLNMGRDQQGQMRAFEPELVYKAQRYGAAMANLSLSYDLHQMGYQVQQGKNHATTIAGYTEEYLQAESPRAQAINQKMREKGYSSRKEAEFVAHSYRNNKLDKTPDEMFQDHQRMAARYGNQQEQVITRASQNVPQQEAPRRWTAREALTQAKESLMIRTDVFSEMDLLTKAAHVGMGSVTEKELREELRKRSQTNAMYREGDSAEFMQARHAMQPGEISMKWTTLEAKDKERRVLDLILQGQKTVTPVLARQTTVSTIEERFASFNHGKGLSSEQAEAVRAINTTPDFAFGLIGVAGSGKTTSVIAPTRELHEAAGFEVIGLAPTGRAARELRDAGIANTMTIAKFLTMNESSLKRKGLDPEKPRLYIVDEVGQVSSTADLELMERIRQSARPQDRMLKVGDPRQHESVDAGRVFEEQLQAGMHHASVTSIMRQRTAEYREVVQYFQMQKPHLAMYKLGEMGCIEENAAGAERIQHIAEKYTKDPAHTLVVSPFNKTRRELNQAIREELREAKQLGPDVIRFGTVYVQRQDINAADLKMAVNYQVGDILVFNKKASVMSEEQAKLPIERGQYAEIIRRNTDPRDQWIEARLYGSNETVRYNPWEIANVSVYQRETRNFAEGDQIILKKPFRGFENGDVLRIDKLESNGNIQAREPRSEKPLRFNLKEMPHLDHAYVSTSYSSQGATVDKVLVDLPTSERGAKDAINNMLGYVATSRGRVEVLVSTDDVRKAIELLGQSGIKAIALSEEEITEYRTQQEAQRIAQAAQLIPALKIITERAEQETSNKWRI